MLRNNVANTFDYLYPIGNTPAVCLTRDLPPETDADILLLGCGDIQDVLFTVCAQNGGGRLDVTCCEEEPAVVARNILLLTLILGDEASENTLKIWNIFYHWKIGPKTQELLQTHATRLVSAATCIDECHSSIWGKSIKFVNHDSLRQATDVWRDFLGPTFSADSQLGKNSSDQARDNAQQTLKTRSTYVGNHSVLTGIRSAFPLASQALKELPALHQEYWRRGFLGTVTASDRPNVANRTIFAIGNRHGVLHYGTDPLLNFHLATAYAPLSKGTALSPVARGAVAAAQKEFATWCDALRHASDRVVVRSFIGDALSLCHTLQGAALGFTYGTSVNLKTHRWTFEDLLLDSGDYASDGNAPTSFDVVDCSNLVDHLGALNVLTAAAPLHKPKVSSTLYTEILVAHEASARDRMNNLLCGDYETISLLLGLGAVTSWSNATATSEIEEGLIASLAQTNKHSD